MSNTTYLHFRCTTIEKEVFRKRAAKCGMNLTDFTIAVLEGNAPKSRYASIDRYFTREALHSMANTGEKEDQVQIRISKKAKKEVEKQAEREGMDVSHFVRQVVIYGREGLLD